MIAPRTRTGRGSRRSVMAPADRGVRTTSMGKVNAPGRTRADAGTALGTGVPNHFALTKVARAIIASWPDGTESLIRTSPPSRGTTTTWECLLTLKWWVLFP